MSVQDAWQEASDSEADLSFAGDELNPHFAYDDEDEHVRHQVWLLDAVTAMNEMRAARQMGIQTFALWALGTEDPSHLEHLGQAQHARTSRPRWKKFQPGNDINYDGEGDILRITGVPHPGSRTIDMDAENQTATDEHMQTYPQPYTIEYYGYHPNKVALSFDDGPDPKWTPKILDILKAQARQRRLHGDRRGGAGQRRPAAPLHARRPRDRQPHLHASGYQRNSHASGAA